MISKEFEAVCVKCGKPTLWVECLGKKPLCLSCFDDELELRSEAEYQRICQAREYYLSHVEENRAGCCRYRLAHRKELNAYYRRYRQRCRDLIASRQRDYYRSNHEAELARSCRKRAKRVTVLT